MSDSLGKHVFRLSGEYPNLELEDPRRKSERTGKRTEKGATYAMETAVKDATTLSNSWQRLVSGLVDHLRNLDGDETGVLTTEEDIADAEKKLKQIRTLDSKHLAALARIRLSQAPSHEIEAQVDLCEKKRETITAMMEEAERLVSRVKSKRANLFKILQGATNVTAAESDLNQEKPKKPSSLKTVITEPSKSSGRSRKSQEEKIVARSQVEAAKKKVELQKQATERKKAARMAAAAAKTEEEEAKEELKAQKELIDAQAKLKAAEQLEALDLEQELGSDDPGDEQVPEGNLRPTAQSFVPATSGHLTQQQSHLQQQAESQDPMTDQGQQQPNAQNVIPPQQMEHYYANPVYVPVPLDPQLYSTPEIKSFSGKSNDWLRFVLAFDEIFAKKISSSSLKLQKLLQYVSPEVQPRIEIFQHDTVHGYERAMRVLWEAYGHPSTLVRHVIDGLVVGKPRIQAKERESLQEFFHQVSTAIETIQIIQNNHARDLKYNYMSCLENQDILVKLLRRLPAQMVPDFVDSLGNRPGSVHEFCKYLEKKTIAGSHPLLHLAFVQNQREPKNNDGKPGQQKKKFVYLTSEDNKDIKIQEKDNVGERQEQESKNHENCPCCQALHKLDDCKAFDEMSPFRRRNVLKSHKLCFNCFQFDHFHDKCKKASRCKENQCQWKNRHDPRVHNPPKTNKTNTPADSQVSPKSVKVSKSDEANNEGQGQDDGRPVQDEGDSYCAVGDKGVFTGVCGVRLVNSQTGESIKCFAMLDSGSSIDVISEEAVEILGLKVTEPKRGSTIHTVIGSHKTKMPITNFAVKHIKDEIEEYFQDVKVVKRGIFDQNRCPNAMDRKMIPEFASIATVEDVDVPKVLLLISVRHGQIQRPQEVTPIGNRMFTVRTKIGHVVYGGEDEEKVGSMFFVNDKDDGMNEQLERYFELDRLGTSQLYDNQKMPSKEERNASEKIAASIRCLDGSYEVAVPWKDEEVVMPDNYEQAKKRVESMRNFFKKNPKEFEDYNDVIQSYIAAGHAERIPEEELRTEPGKKHYLLHHSVKHPRKKKRRVVYNASKKVGGKSVNDRIMKCPDKLERLLGLIIRYREHQIAITGDIVSFFHMVKIPKRDQDFGRFVWFERGQVDGKVVEFRLLKHLFGGIASQCCAVMALNHCLQKQVPHRWTQEFANEAVRSFYSDDFLKSYESLDEAKKAVQEIVKVLAENGFELSKFKSNDVIAEGAIKQESDLPGQEKSEIKVGKVEESALGITWNLQEDILIFRPPPVIASIKKTKRSALSFLMSLYDPLGLISPFVLPLKLFIQKLVVLKVDWDDPFSPEHEEEFDRCIQNIVKVEEMKVQRCYTSSKLGKVVNRQLHAFADGSQDAYGCCIYLRSEDEDGKVETQLVMAKSKVCPVRKSLSVPRIELSAGVLDVRVCRLVHDELSIPIDAVKYWVDSISTLRYIRNECRRFQIFIAHRIAEIQDRTNVEDWHFVPTKKNPADLASRPTFLRKDPANDDRVRMWLEGPEFLRQDQAEWPESPIDIEISTDDPEIKVQAFAVEISEDISLLSKSLVKAPNMFIMKQRVAILMKFCKFLKKKDDVIEKLNVDDLEKAEVKIVMIVQREEYGEEITTLKKGAKAGTGRRVHVKKNSRIYKLSPFLDENGILRVYTRFFNGDFPFEYKFPAVLPKDHHVTQLKIIETHKLLGHQGKKAVLNYLRKRFWIVQASSAVDSVLKHCHACKRYHSRLCSQIMADLPEERIAVNEPFFTYTSVDLFGPIEVKRARSTVKRYGALFCCMTSRSIHLEPVFTLEMDSFIDAFRRFQARRGQVRRLWSDNATNFTSANKELRAVIVEWNKSGLGQRFLQRGVDWKFLPSRASHMGGVHERLIRSARSCLRHVLQQQTLNDESFMTLLTECEFALNSRPLTQASTDPSDLASISPNDVLIPRPGPGLPPGEHPPGEAIRRRWRTVQQLTNQFWKRFVKEYLNILSLRSKWLLQKRDLAKNDLVLVADFNLPRCQWNVARVLETFAGRDGRVRSCRVKTKTSSSLVRPVVKLCLLEATALEK